MICATRNTRLESQVARLKKEKEELRASLELAQVEVEGLKEQASMTVVTLKITTGKMIKLEELECRAVKQECFNRRSNIKFFGISDNEQESPEDTEVVLRNFLHKEMKLSKKHLDDIEFERVHRIPTRIHEEKINQHLRPIIAKVSFFKDKQQIKSHIKHLPRGKGFGVADDFPKEVQGVKFLFSGLPPIFSYFFTKFLVFPIFQGFTRYTETFLNT